MFYYPICSHLPDAHVSAPITLTLNERTRERTVTFRNDVHSFRFKAVNSGPGIVTIEVNAKDSFTFRINLIAGESTGSLPIYVTSPRIGLDLKFSTRGTTNAELTYEALY